MKYLYVFLMIFFFNCSSTTQFTFYQPTQNEDAWKISVIQSSGKDSFKCIINDFEVMKESFGMYGDSFEKEDLYLGKKIIMSGYRRNAIIPGTSPSYVIRIFIERKEAAKFDF
jgi:hypothetical protein